MTDVSRPPEYARTIFMAFLRGDFICGWGWWGPVRSPGLECRAGGHRDHRGHILIVVPEDARGPGDIVVEPDDARRDLLEVVLLGGLADQRGVREDAVGAVGVARHGELQEDLLLL